MDKLSIISGKELVRILLRSGFLLVRTNGSHHRLRHPDGRVTTVYLIPWNTKFISVL